MFVLQHFRLIKMKNLRQIEWRNLLSEDSAAEIIDVRTPNECAEGIIENATIINFLEASAFLEAINKLDKNKNYYLYCRSGSRSAQACHRLDSIGFKSTYNLVGGMLAWNGKIVTPA